MAVLKLVSVSYSSLNGPANVTVQFRFKDAPVGSPITVPNNGNFINFPPNTQSPEFYTSGRMSCNLRCEGTMTIPPNVSPINEYFMIHIFPGGAGVFRVNYLVQANAAARATNLVESPVNLT